MCLGRRSHVKAIESAAFGIASLPDDGRKVRHCGIFVHHEPPAALGLTYRSRRPPTWTSRPEAPFHLGADSTALGKTNSATGRAAVGAEGDTCSETRAAFLSRASDFVARGASGGFVRAATRTSRTGDGRQLACLGRPDVRLRRRSAPLASPSSAAAAEGRRTVVLDCGC